MLDVPVPLTILQALADETRRRLELAGQIEHPGESGRAREQSLTIGEQRLARRGRCEATVAVRSSGSCLSTR